jgi:CRISPR type III-B/RAMP module-associated protein Cmr3
MPYFALPFDLLVRKDQTTTRLRPHPLPWPDLYAIPPALKTLWTNEEGEVAKDRLLNATNLKAYLGDSPAVSTPQHALWDSETRVGIELSGRRTAEEGKLYTVEFTRLKGTPQAPVGFLMQVTGLEGTGFPASGLLTLGGENHGAKYEKLEDNDLARHFKEMVIGDKLKEKLQGKPGFKLYLATPALFQNGWVPDFLAEDGGAYHGRVGRVELKLVAAAVGKAVSIGGWDLVRKKPRSMRKAVPAGSVYFFEKADGPLEDQDIETLFHAFHFKSLLCKDWSQWTGEGEPPLAEDGKAGFGLALLSVWLKEEAHV